MTLKHLITRLFGGNGRSSGIKPSSLVQRLGEEVLDGKAIFFDEKGYDDVVYLAKRGVNPVIYVDYDCASFKVAHLANSIDPKLKVSEDSYEKVDTASDIICARSINPISPTFMDDFVVKNAPYEAFIVDCGRPGTEGLSQQHFNLLMDYAGKAVSEDKFLVLKNVGERLIDYKNRDIWTQIANENQFMEEDYGVLLRKGTSDSERLSNELKQMRERLDSLRRN